jgi:hypothetical protein
MENDSSLLAEAARIGPVVEDLRRLLVAATQAELRAAAEPPDEPPAVAGH